MPLEFSHVSITVPLVTLDDAKAHLAITGTDRDDYVTAIRDAAQTAIVKFMGPAADDTWTDATVPAEVAHAIKLLIGHFWQFRGDDEQSKAAPDPWPHIANLLGRSRDPAMA